jgi:hypothetical protein
MPTVLTPTPTLELVLQGLHESEIRCGIQNEPPAGGITAWIDFGSRTEKATFYGTIVGDQEVWPAADRIAQREEQKSAGADGADRSPLAAERPRPRLQCHSVCTSMSAGALSEPRRSIRRLI